MRFMKGLHAAGWFVLYNHNSVQCYNLTILVEAQQQNEIDIKLIIIKLKYKKMDCLLTFFE